jgi:hypothetical protein
MYINQRCIRPRVSDDSVIRDRTTETCDLHVSVLRTSRLEGVFLTEWGASPPPPPQQSQTYTNSCIQLGGVGRLKCKTCDNRMSDTYNNQGHYCLLTSKGINLSSNSRLPNRHPNYIIWIIYGLFVSTYNPPRLHNLNYII